MTAINVTQMTTQKLIRNLKMLPLKNSLKENEVVNS